MKRQLPVAPKKNIREVGEQPRATPGMFFSPIFCVFYLRPAPRELAYMVIFIDSQEVFLFVFGIYLLFIYIHNTSTHSRALHREVKKIIFS
jgi:hypothetical protein